MSFDGQVLCQRMLIGPWALTTLGAATAAAPVAPAASRNLRREAVFDVGLDTVLDVSDFSTDISPSQAFEERFAGV